MESRGQHNVEDPTRRVTIPRDHEESDARRVSYFPPARSNSEPNRIPRFSVASTGELLSSGFTYDQRLRPLGVTNEEWFQFTSEVVNKAKLTMEEDKLAWTAGISAGTLSSPFLLVFAPWAGYKAGKAVHKKTVVAKVKERLLEDGEVRQVLRKWNEGAWAAKGFHAWIEFPGEPGTDNTEEELKRFRIAVIPNDDFANAGYRSPTSPLAHPAHVQSGTPPAVSELQGPIYRKPVGSQSHVSLSSQGRPVQPGHPDTRQKYEYARVPAEGGRDENGEPLPIYEGPSNSGPVASGPLPAQQPVYEMAGSPVTRFELDGGRAGPRRIPAHEPPIQPK